MCGRFSQSMTREDYLSLLADEADRDIAYDPEPIGRFNVAPGTRVLLLSERDEPLHLDPVLWGYAPGWWDKAPDMQVIACEGSMLNRIGYDSLIHGVGQIYICPMNIPVIRDRYRVLFSPLKFFHRQQYKQPFGVNMNSLLL